MTALRGLLVGVRGHGGEEVYCAQLRDQPPAGVRFEATFDFHSSCPGARCQRVLEIALNRLVHPWAAPDQGFRALRLEGDFDLVHVHTHPTLLLGRGDTPVVFSAGSSHFHYLRDYEGWSEAHIRRRYARARAIFGALGVLDSLLSHQAITLAYTFSEWARQAYLDAGVPAGKIRVLPPGFDVSLAPAPRPRDPVTFLFMGRNPRRKGGDLVLQAFRELRHTHTDARLLFVSDELPEVAEPGVEALPLVPASQVGLLYARADVFVNPTRAEGFGFSNAEAQGYGLPVVSSRVGPIADVVEHGATGLLVEAGDGPALLEAMQRLAAARTLRVDMGARARERFLERFAYPVFQRGLRALYDEALALGGRA